MELVGWLQVVVFVIVHVWCAWVVNYLGWHGLLVEGEAADGRDI
jgi:hypothetical protein